MMPFLGTLRPVRPAREPSSTSSTHCHLPTSTVGKDHVCSWFTSSHLPQTGSPWEWGLVSCVPPVPWRLEFSQQSLARGETQGWFSSSCPPSSLHAPPNSFCLLSLWRSGPLVSRKEGAKGEVELCSLLKGPSWDLSFL